MLLSGKVRAAELIEEAPKIVRALLAGMTRPQQENLVMTAFDATVLASTPTRNTKQCLVDLICTARGLKLPPRLAQPALLALTSADPRGLRDHLELIWPWLDAAFGWADATGQDAEKEEQRRVLSRIRLMKEVFDRVQPSDFVDALAVGRRISLEQFGGVLEWAEAADWWSQTLLANTAETKLIRAACAFEFGSQISYPTERELISGGLDDGGADGAEPISDREVVGLYRREAPLLRIGWVGAFPVSDIPMFG
jgi:hypothetical protein